MRLNAFLLSVACTLMAHQLVAADEPKQPIALPEMQAIWRPCSDELKSSPISEDIEVYSPECPAVNGTESRCILKKGTFPTIIVKFKPKITVANLERVIIARVPALETQVEVPYGPPISPCDNSTLLASDGTSCVNGGVEAGKVYVYPSTFEVKQSFPAVQDLETRFILRQKNDKHKKLRLYKKHPGPTVYCVVVPRIFVIE